ncbi:MAG: UDP-N-acetyl glucosamine 2-epimerase [Candidatus Brocadiaceae bacterium]|nr:UDP-N-acetyl glucosamine 2-epimerase [Candidatus Brocadiaceae bacterium]
MNKTKKTIIHVVEARPNFMKIDPIFVSVEKDNSIFIEQYIVHAGQHYGMDMPGAFFSDLGMVNPHLNLNIGGIQEETTYMEAPYFTI